MAGDSSKLIAEAEAIVASVPETGAGVVYDAESGRLYGPEGVNLEPAHEEGPHLSDEDLADKKRGRAAYNRRLKALRPTDEGSE